jgi:mono/diheme cytochrome c family protein
MKRFSLLAALAVVALAALAAGCGGGGKPSDNKDKGGEAALTRPEAKDPYKGKTNTKTSAEDVAEGKKIFDAQCALCHGEKGDGDSPAGKALTPPAANFTDAKLQDAMKDDYMFWRIREGGAAMGYTGMTPFNADTLKDDQVWQVISYIRSLKK